MLLYYMQVEKLQWACNIPKRFLNVDNPKEPRPLKLGVINLNDEQNDAKRECKT